MIGGDWYGYAESEPKQAEGGKYYCGCDYVSGVPNCETHGDPVEKWPIRETTTGGGDA